LYDESGHPEGPPLNGGDVIWGLAFSNDAHELASIAGGTKLLVWNLDTRRFDMRAQDLMLTGPILCAGDWIVAAGEGALHSWHTSGGGDHPIPLAGEDNVMALAATADGRTIAAGSRSIYLLDVTHDAITVRPHPIEPGRSVSALAFDVRGERLVSGGDDGVATVWNPNSAARLGELPRGRMALTRLAFQPIDGGFLAVGAIDGSLSLFDVESRREVACLRGCQVGTQPSIMALAFSPTGVHLASAGLDYHVTLWSLALDEWQRVACRIAGRDLAVEERRAFVGDGTVAVCPAAP
jgi:WD40 repeat protein